MLAFFLFFQVNAIWEGTTNILSLDVLRAITKSSGTVLKCYHEDVTRRIQAGRSNAELQEAVTAVQQSVNNVLGLASKLSPDLVEMAARDFAFSLARIYMGE